MMAFFFFSLMRGVKCTEVCNTTHFTCSSNLKVGKLFVGCCWVNLCQFMGILCSSTPVQLLGITRGECQLPPRPDEAALSCLPHGRSWRETWWLTWSTTAGPEPWAQNSAKTSPKHWVLMPVQTANHQHSIWRHNSGALLNLLRYHTNNAFLHSYHSPV